MNRLPSLLLLIAFSVLAARPSFAQASPEAPKPAPEQAQARLLGFGQLFAGHQTQWSAGQRFNEFHAERAELGMGFLWRSIGGFFINAETIRSAGPQSLFGIDNNSLVLRLKHGFGQVEPKLGPLSLQLRAGLLPDVWVERVENSYDLRGVSPTLAEGGRFFDTSDLGASVSVSAWHEAVELRFGLTNGEGRNERELNAGKNAMTMLRLRPLQWLRPDPRWDLALQAGYRDGSVGPSSLPNHRLAFALTGRFERIFAGAEYIKGTGYPAPVAQAQDASTDTQGFGLWLNGNLYWPWLGAYATYHHVEPDTARADGAIDALRLGLYLDAIDAPQPERSVLGFPRLRLYLGYQRHTFGQEVSALPGRAELATTHQLLVTLSARGAFLGD